MSHKEKDQRRPVFHGLLQCLGSESVVSASFWLPGSESAKISADPDPRCEISTKNCKKIHSQNSNLNC